MKIKQLDNDVSDFEPLRLEIVLETQEELLGFLARLRVTNEDVEQVTGFSADDLDELTELYDFVSAEVENRGLEGA